MLHAPPTPPGKTQRSRRRLQRRHNPRCVPTLARARVSTLPFSHTRPGRSQCSVLTEELAALHGRLEGRVAALASRTDLDSSRAATLELRVRQLETELDNAKGSLEERERHLTHYKCDRTLCVCACVCVSSVGSVSVRWWAQGHCAGD